MTINVSLPTLVLSVALSIPTTLIINHLVNPPPRFAVFDLKGTVQAYSKDLAERGLDDSTLTLKTRQFSVMLDAVLTSYSHQNNVTLLVEPAVIKGAPNVTRPLQKEISQALSRLPS
ncbi:TrbI F-type domain-containing protein [Photobacterium toruni]|uniref:TrbI F-type domain-containing protein n=1 Tax=Photobacterium toruni TaxID=1935446 RepID=UPI002E180001|nr:TrbI F-type domain-containing protein [Photobacterium toruni]